MSSLRDALSNLEEQTHQIHELAVQTASRPLAGRFTKAYLQGTQNIFSIIREAANHERGLFNFIGESGLDDAGQPVVEGMAAGNLVERRKPGMVTPLRKPPAAGGDDPVKLLDKALTLVDEYRSMPRARAHVVDLMESFLTTQQAIKDLEQQIEEAKQGGAKPGPGSGAKQSIEVQDTPEPTFESPDDWLKAEEEAIKKLEKEIAAKRRSQPAGGSRSRGANNQNELATTPSPTLLTRTSRPMSMASPGSPLKSMRFPASPRHRERMTMQTPIKQTPLRMGTVPQSPETPTTDKNTTPTRPTTLGSPGRPTGAVSSRTTTTPRFAQTTTSLAAKINALTPHRSRPSEVNEKRRITSYSAPQEVSPGPFLANSSGPSGRGKRVGLFGLSSKEGPKKQAEPIASPRTKRELPSERAAEPVGESTVMEARPTSPSPAPAEEVGDETVTGPSAGSEQVDPVPPATQADPMVEGVRVDSPAVKDGITTVWTLVPEVLRSEEAGPEVCAGKTLDVRGTVALLAKIASVTDIRAPSPSNVSVASSSLQSTTPGSAPPLTKPPPTTDSNVLMCHLILFILRTDDVMVSMPDLKKYLDDVSKGKGWEGRAGTTAFYAAVAKKLIKIDRKGPVKGGTVRLDKV